MCLQYLIFFYSVVCKVLKLIVSFLIDIMHDAFDHILIYKIYISLVGIWIIKGYKITPSTGEGVSIQRCQSPRSWCDTRRDRADEHSNGYGLDKNILTSLVFSSCIEKPLY